MLPIYFVVGLINIFAQHHNYGIKIDDPNFDIRVRRSIEDTEKHQNLILNNNVEKYLKTDFLQREKRYAYYKNTKITNNVSNNTHENYNNGSRSRNGNRYDIFNPNYNFLFNTTTNNSNNSGVKNGYINNNRPIIRSYPYGYPPGYGPKTNAATGSDAIPTTPRYRNQNSNTPYFYNYQNPDGQNFGGYVGYTTNKSGYNNVTPGYNNVPVPYAPRYTPSANNTGANNYAPWNNTLAPYPSSYTQNPLANIMNNNSVIHNLPHAPANEVYNNNFNSIPTPFNKDNLSPYAPNFNNGSATPNNVFTPYSPVNNTDITSNVNLTVTTTEKMVIASGCVIMCHIKIPCPQFMKRFGRFCVPEAEVDADDDYN